MYHNKTHCNKIENTKYTACHRRDQTLYCIAAHLYRSVLLNLYSLYYSDVLLYCIDVLLYSGRLCFLPSFRDHSHQGGLDFRLLQRYISSWFILNF